MQCLSKGLVPYCYYKDYQYRERVYSAWGEWSAWQTTAVTSNDTTDVKTQTALMIQ